MYKTAGWRSGISQGSNVGPSISNYWVRICQIRGNPPFLFQKERQSRAKFYIYIDKRVETRWQTPLFLY